MVKIAVGDTVFDQAVETQAVPVPASLALMLPMTALAAFAARRGRRTARPF